MDARSPFHAGEQMVQQRVGTRAMSEELGQAMIRPSMPLQHRQFFASQPLLFVGGQDAAGRVWASAAAGPPGFVSSPDSGHLALVPRSLAPGGALQCNTAKQQF